MIETTINIRIDTKRKLAEAAEECGISISKLIVKLMKKAMKKPTVMAECFSRIKYQPKAPKYQWQRLHVSLFARDYEYFLDMRKLYKCSVSLLVAICSEKHLESLLNDVRDDNHEMDTDNYPFNNYVILHTWSGDVSCWKIYWGMPEKPEEVLII